MPNTITRRSALFGAAAVAALTVIQLPTQTDEQWSFAIGQLVSHRDQPMLSEIVGRVRTNKGIEVYGVRRLADVPVVDLIILGEVLVPVADEYSVRSAEAALLRQIQVA